MKKRSTIIMVLVFFIGLLVLLYPSISEFYNQKVQSKSIVDYESLLKKIDKNKYDKIFEEADEYNSNLRNLHDQFIDYRNLDNYKNILDVDGHGMIGYVSIEKIIVELPIYHGTSDTVLSNASGHLEGTSFPIGGIGTHSAISAHRGLASATLFTNPQLLRICFAALISSIGFSVKLTLIVLPIPSSRSVPIPIAPLINPP